MSDTTFIAKVTHILSSWLNDVNKAVYRAIGAGGVAPQTPAEVVTNLGLPAAGGSDNIGVLHSGGGAFLETLSDALNREVWIESFMSPAMKADVAAGNLAVDVMPALIDANLCFPNNLDDIFYSNGGRVNLGRGKFKVTGPWQLNRNIHWRGLTAPMRNSRGATQLFFDDNNLDAIVAEWYLNDSSAHMGTGLILENMYLACNRVAGTTGKGLVARTPINGIRLWFENFRDDNIFNVSTAPLGGSVGSVDFSFFEHIITTGSGGNGIYNNGGNSNVMSFVNIDAKGNDKYGINDSSFLGNGWFVTHTSGNGAKTWVTHGGNLYYVLKDDPFGGATEPGTDPAVWRLMGAGVTSSYQPEWVPGGVYWKGGAYRADNPNARSVFTMAYAEGGQPPSFIKFPNAMIGGLHPIFTAETDGIIIGDHVIDAMPSLLTSFSRARFPSTVASTNTFTTAFGLAASTNCAMEMVATGDDSHGLGWVWEDSTKMWLIQHNLGAPRIAARYTTKNSTLTAGRSAAVGPGNVMHSQGLFFGGSVTSASTANLRHLGGGTSTPPSGEVAQGDVWMNTSAAAGGKPGDVCTTGGTAGSTAVYKPMANLGA